MGEAFEIYDESKPIETLGDCQRIDDDVNITDNSLLTFHMASPEAFNRSMGLCYNNCDTPYSINPADTLYVDWGSECRMSYVTGDPGEFEGRTAMYRCKWTD